MCLLPAAATYPKLTSNPGPSQWVDVIHQEALLTLPLKYSCTLCTRVTKSELHKTIMLHAVGWIMYAQNSCPSGTYGRPRKQVQSASWWWSTKCSWPVISTEIKCICRQSEFMSIESNIKNMLLYLVCLFSVNFTNKFYCILQKYQSITDWKYYFKRKKKERSFTKKSFW